MSKTAKVFESGGSLVMIIPKSYAEWWELKAGDIMDLSFNRYDDTLTVTHATTTPNTCNFESKLTSIALKVYHAIDGKHKMHKAALMKATKGTYSTAKATELLKSGIGELIEIGFLKPESRYDQWITRNMEWVA